VIRDEKLVDHARDLGAYAMERLREMRARLPVIGEIRGVGLVMGVPLRYPDGRPANDLADRTLYAAMRRGLSFKTTMGNILTLTPALVLTRREMDQALEILEAALREALMDSPVSVAAPHS
jgi:4-aminobutyrate aminotransferase